MNLFIRPAIIRRALLMMALVPAVFILFFSLNAFSANPDTTGFVSFRLNMTRAVNQHIFVPDSGYVYLIMDSVEPLRLLPGPGNIYTATLLDRLDSGTVYNYHFSINDSVPETVRRSLKALPGVMSVTAWWNNEPLNVTTFIVNMRYAAQFGMFNPASDSVYIVGTMNPLADSPKMQRIDTTLSYSYVDTLLVPGSVQKYKYRINAATGGMEYTTNRIVRIPDTLLTVTSDFNNYNPAKRLMTFQCDMGYYVKAHHFDITADYLDVAGNFNGSGANDVLFDTDKDTVYTLETFMDTAWINQGPLSFKFRINGNWNTAELTGKPNRVYAFHDTINQNPNIFGCQYNNLNPSVPTAPWAYDVNIQGLLIINKFLSGTYSYENVNGIPEGISSYRWLRSNNALGTDTTFIPSATKITYVVDTLDIGKWLVFEITPRAASGDSATGNPVRVVSSNSISAWDVGMNEHGALITRVYPNPASDYVTVESGKEIDQVALINYLDQEVLMKENIGSKSTRFEVGSLPAGLYLLRVSTKSGQRGVARVMKY